MIIHSSRDLHAGTDLHAGIWLLQEVLLDYQPQQKAQAQQHVHDAATAAGFISRAQQPIFTTK